MRKTVPVVVGAGALLLIASQFLKLDWRFPNIPIEEQVQDRISDAGEAIGDGVDKVKETLVGDETVDPSSKPENQYLKMNHVDVIIDGDRYLIATKDQTEATKESISQRKSVAVDEVVRLAKDLPGEANGIKVRIWRTSEATAQAEQQLLASLGAADVPADVIDSRSRLVE